MPRVVVGLVPSCDFNGVARRDKSTVSKKQSDIYMRSAYTATNRVAAEAPESIPLVYLGQGCVSKFVFGADVIDVHFVFPFKW